VKEAETASETVSVIRSSKRAFTLDRTWYNIKNLWKGKKKAELEEIEESEKQFYTLSSPSLIKNPFKEALFKPVFNSSELEEGLLEFRKRKDKETSSKNLAQFLSKHLRNLLQIRE